ncbi:transcriptional regulator [Salmonella phage 41]|nr:transcriptional regulator [Salmonella phage 41]
MRLMQYELTEHPDTDEYQFLVMRPDAQVLLDIRSGKQ